MRKYVGGVADFSFSSYNGKLDLYYIFKIIYPVIKKCISYFCWMHWNYLEKLDSDGLCVSIFLKNMGCYFGVIGNVNNHEFIIYIFTGKV